jgi:hypothetical protein
VSALPPAFSLDQPPPAQPDFGNPSLSVSKLDQRIIRPKVGIPALIFVIVAVALILVGMVFFAIGRVTPNQFDHAAFSVQYPEGWTPMDTTTAPTCRDASPPCALLLGNTPFNSVTIQFRVFETSAPRTLQDIEANEWNNMKAADSSLQLVRQETAPVAGIPAVSITYRQQRGSENWAYTRTVAVISPTRFLGIIVAATSPARYNDNKSAVDSILASIKAKS